MMVGVCLQAKDEQRDDSLCTYVFEAKMSKEGDGEVREKLICHYDNSF